MKNYLPLLLLLPLSAFAADGDLVKDANVTKGSYSSQTYALCDGKSSSDSTCSEFDLNSATTEGVGGPDYIIFSRDLKTDCTGNVTIAVNSQTLTGGAENIIATLNDSGTAATVKGPFQRFIDADLTNMTACSDMDVNMQLVFWKK